MFKLNKQGDNFQENVCLTF